MNIPSHYLERITAIFPPASPASMRINRDGLMNDVVIVPNGDATQAVRFAKNEAGKRALQREDAVLATVRQVVSIAVPHFTWHGDDCVSYLFLAGVPLDRNTLLRQDEATQNRLAAELATFLHQLHTIPAEMLTALPLKPVPPPSLDEVRQQYEEVRTLLDPYLWADQKAWVDGLYRPVLDGSLGVGYTPALIHNDLASYHILFDPVERRISGVIDFGVAEVGDPAADLAQIINNHGESFLRRMLPVYPEIAAALARARFRAGVIELWWLLQGLRTNDLSWFMVHIGRARDVLPWDAEV
jgi:aminoglycoside 2''-phosphotransferase